MSRVFTGSVTVTGLSGPLPTKPLTARLSGQRLIAPTGWTGLVCDTTVLVLSEVHSRVACPA